MQDKSKGVDKKESQVKLKNKKDLSTGFGAFHTDNHSNW